MAGGIQYDQSAWIAGRHDPGTIFTAMEGRKYQSATENPNSLTGPEILGLPHLPMCKKAAPLRERLLLKISLAVSYSHMGRPHTTIGAERFHFRVRNGIGWFPLAIAARQFGRGEKWGRTAVFSTARNPSLFSMKTAVRPRFSLK